MVNFNYAVFDWAQEHSDSELFFISFKIKLIDSLDIGSAAVRKNNFVLEAFFL